MKNLLLPYPWKFAGWLLTLIGIALSSLYFFFDFKFKMPVFAIYSSFFETKFFATFRTNFADELIMLLLILGLGLTMFSKEKNESENMDQIRAKALAKATITNIIFLLFSVLFIYGSGFITILVLNLFSPPTFYLFFFFFAKRKGMII